MFLRIGIVIFLGLFAGTTQAVDSKDLAQLEKAYRNLIIAIHNKDLDTILSYVHPDGLGGADTSTPKSQIAQDLKEKASHLNTVLFDSDAEIAEELCSDQGRAPLSPFVFYQKFGDQYKVTTSVLKEGEYYSVAAMAKAEDDKRACQYFLFGLTFAKTKEGKFLLISNFR